MSPTDPPPPLPGPIAPDPAARPVTSGRAVAVLVLGIAAVPLSCAWIGLVPAIIALALTPGARRQIRDSHGRVGGAGFVLAGAVCALVALVFVVVLTAWLVFVLATQE